MSDETETKRFDETEGWRLCLICGSTYFGKHSECPHENVARIDKMEEL